jgi:hypothetical protein
MDVHMKKGLSLRCRVDGKTGTAVTSWWSPTHTRYKVVPDDGSDPINAPHYNIVFFDEPHRGYQGEE